MGIGKKYPRYIDSGIEWIGQIPISWDVRKLKYFFSFEKGQNAQAYTNEYLVANPGNYPVFSGQTEDEGVMGRISTYDYETGNVLFSTTVGAKAMTTRMISGKYSLSQNCALLIPKSKNMDVRFYRYFVDRLFDYEKGLISLIMQPSLRFEDLVRYQIVVPAMEEQGEIADHLDRKTAQIDDLIDKKERMIELLREERAAVINQAVTKGLDPKAEMKDSGIEWLDKIPRHWKMNKLKHTTYIKGRVGWQALTTNEYITEGPYLVTGTDFLEGEICWEGCFHVSIERYGMDPYIQLKNGDLLITKDGTIGKVAVVKNMPGNSTLNSGIFLTRPIAQDVYLSDYMYWVLNSEIFSNFIEYTKKGSTISHLYQEVFREFVYPVPNIEEQQQIVNFLSNRTKEIDSLVVRCEKQILYLKEYCTSLISEVVTGKICVCE